MKKLLAFIFVVAVGASLWFGFALWTGLYSVYTFPPTKADPDGRTLIVSRELGEPMFNSPAVKPPAPKKSENRGIGFGATQIKRPLDKRTVVELPYIEWAYDKSIEDSQAEQAKQE